MRIIRIHAAVVILAVLSASAYAQSSDRDLGIDLYRQGNFLSAIESLEEAVALDRTDRAAWMFLGGAYVHAGELNKARVAFGKSSVRPETSQPKYDKSVKVTYKPKATYTERARQSMSSGIVRIAVEFRADGKIGFTVPLMTTLDAELVQQSLDAARGIKFEPAEKDGKPVTVINLVEYGFFTR